MSKKTVIIDNYDSFTYNLVHIVEEILHEKVTVLKNDKIDFDTMNRFDKIILSPGPGIPNEAGFLLQIIKQLSPTKHILGVCLGMQAMGEVFGARLVNMNDVFHGMKTKMIQTKPKGDLFENIPNEFFAGRYHSWVIDPSSDLSAFHINVLDESGQIMAVQHKKYKVYGVQFHPESIMTPQGPLIIKNFLNIT